MYDRDELDALLGQHRTVLVAGTIDDDLSNRVRQQLLAMSLAESAPVKILIDSQGGDTQEGLWLFDLIKGLPVPTVGIAIGKCWSMATILLQACSDRAALPHASFLLHSVRACAHDVHTTDAILRALERRRSEERRLMDIVLERSALTRTDLRKRMRDGDRNQTQISSADALRLRLIDRITVQLMPDPPASS